MVVHNNVLVFSHELPPEGGGAGVVGLQYCNELSLAGFKVTLLTKKKMVYPDSLSNVDIIGVGYIPKLYLLPYYFELKRLDLSQYTHIVLNDMVATYVAGFCFSGDELGKSVSVLHGSEPELVYQSTDIYKKIIGFKYFYNKALTKVRKIIAVSEYMKKKMLEESPFNDKNKIIVHYSKLGANFFPMIVDFGLSKKQKDKEIILTVSRIEKGKGFFEMYQVFKKLVLQDSSYHWVIVGDGSYRNEFENLVISENMQSYMDFIGKVDRDSLKEYYQSADVFWLLSNYKESFGLVYLEAQACLCPAIGFNKYGVRETIMPGKTGFLVDNAEECVDIFLQQQYKDLNNDDFYHFLNEIHNSTIDEILNI